MEASLAVVVVECRLELVGPMDAAAIHDHHDVCAGFTQGGHDLMEILASLLGITVRHNFREDLGGAIVDRADDAEQHPARDATPRAILHPRGAFAGLIAFDLALAQRACGNACALGGAPPARAGQGKTPEDRFVFIEHNDLTAARLVFEGGEFERAVGESRWGGIQSASGAVEAYRVFFQTPRTLSRPSWTPVSRAKTVASSRQLHWEWIEPCWRGS
jgi:hypothetical protein